MIYLKCLTWADAGKKARRSILLPDRVLTEDLGAKPADHAGQQQVRDFDEYESGFTSRDKSPLTLRARADSAPRKLDNTTQGCLSSLAFSLDDVPDCYSTPEAQVRAVSWPFSSRTGRLNQMFSSVTLETLAGNFFVKIVSTILSIGTHMASILKLAVEKVQRFCSCSSNSLAQTFCINFPLYDHACENFGVAVNGAFRQTTGPT